ncbi:MAG: 30S ribosomal protein S4 [Clostridiaceae bacterium]|jgi:small subunit ribosomal protein S4|nr:30S ribosomal protein S4 [Clostridiaceae bacterium]
MARYTDAKCRLCRREGSKLYLKGDRCYTDKCAVARRAYAPGQHGQGRKKISEYGIQLREKQKVRRIYGILEKQFRGYFDIAERQKGVTGENLLRLLELRFDNVVYRMGFGESRVEARQLVRHGHFTVNGKKVNIPSYQIGLNDLIAVKPGSKNTEKFKELAENAAGKTAPQWLSINAEMMEARVVALPVREDIDLPIEEHLIVELYSR